MSVDPLGGDASSPQTLGGFGYAVNDPINSADPSGMMDEATCRALGLLSCGMGNYNGPSIGSGPSFDNAGLWGGGANGGWIGGGNNGPQCGVNPFCNWTGPGAAFQSSANPVLACVSHSTGGGWSQPTCTLYWGDERLERVIDQPVARIMAGPASGKRQFCEHQSNMAALAAVIPGGEYLFQHEFTQEMAAAAGVAITNEGALGALEHFADKGIESGGLFRALRSAMGVPKTYANAVSSFAEIGAKAYSYFSIAKAAYQGMRAGQKSYAYCME